MSLLTEAKKHSIGRGPKDISVDDKMELALAWIRDEITLTGAARALGVASTTSCYGPFAVGLREAYRRGLLRMGVKK